MEEKRTKFAEQLHRWATDEMQWAPEAKYANSAPPTVADLKKLYRGESVNALTFLMSHIKSEKNVKLIKSNIELANKSVSNQKLEEEKRKLKAERDKLRSMVDNTRSNIGLVKTEVDQINKELISTDQRLNESKASLREFQQRQSLLQGYDQKMQNLIALLTEYNKRLTVIAQRLIIKKDSKSSENVLKDGENIESSMSASLKQILGAIQQLLIHLHINHNKVASIVFNSLQSQSLSSEEAKNVESTVESTVEKLFNEPIALLDSLIQLSKVAGQALKHDVENFDMKKEAQQFKSKLEATSGDAGYLSIDTLLSEVLDKENLADNANSNENPSSKVKAVSELLQEQRKEQIARFVATEGMKNQIAELKMQMDQFKNRRLSMDGAASNDKENDNINSTMDSKRKLIMDLQDIEVLLAQEKAALQVTDQIVKQLATQKDVLKKDLDLLVALYSKILQFDSLNQEKQAFIQEMIKQNETVRKAFEARKKDIKSFVAQKIFPFKQILLNLSRSAHQAMAREVASFDRLSLKSLLKTGEGENERLVSDLSITRQTLPNPMREELCDALSLPTSKSSEEILPHIIKMKYRAEDFEAKDEDFKANMQDMNDDLETPQVSDVENLEAQVKKLEEMQLGQWLPVLESTLQNIQSGTENCDNVQQLVNDWWNQPAQHLVDWIEIDGMNYSQWLAKWRDLWFKLHNSSAK